MGLTDNFVVTVIFKWNINDSQLIASIIYTLLLATPVVTFEGEVAEEQGLFLY